MFPWSSAADKRERATAKLYEAVRKGDAEKVRALLRKGNVDVNTMSGDSLHLTPLHWASREGHAPVVGVLLKAGADLNATDYDGLTPLRWASREGHVPVVRVLLKAGADLNATANDGMTPLHWASREGHAPVVGVLLKAGADLNATDWFGLTPLHWASRKGHVPVVRVLLKAGADLNARAKSGYKPLHVACSSHRSETVRALLAVHLNHNQERSLLAACILRQGYFSTDESVHFSSETLKTLQVLVSNGATWDATCDDAVASGFVYEESPAVRLCILLWTQQYADGLELSNIPTEVIQRGIRSTQAYIDALKTSLQTVLRRKICLVGSSCAGKTSLVKSITSEHLQPQLEHVDDRTIGIDHFPLRFKQLVASRKEIKIHEVTFWDFAGQDAYQVAHSLFFSPRTLFLVCVDLEAFTTAFLQASIMAHVKKQEKQLMDEFIEHKVMHWIRLILARQPDAEFAFVAMKEDLLKENEVTEKLLKQSLLAKLKEVETTVCEMRMMERETEERPEPKASSAPMHAEVATTTPNVVFTSSTSSESVRAARDQVQDLIVKSERSFVMPDVYSQALEAIRWIRESAKGHDVSTQIQQAFVPVDSLPAALKIADPEQCRVILQTLHDLGDVLWFEDLGVDLFRDTAILDPLLLIDFIRQVINHKHTGVTMAHSDLKSLPYWVCLSDKTQMKAIKQVLQKFHLVYPDDEAGVMDWDSDLIVPAFWQTKTPAAWLFLGDILRINTTMPKEGESVRVDWEYHFEYGLPSSLFDHLVVASVSPHYKFDAGPDWILYEEKGATACRIMVGRDVKSLHRTIHVEAIAAETADEEQVDKLWGTFRQLCGSFVAVMRGYPGLTVSSFAWDDAENKINMKRLVQSPAPEDSAKWMPPAATWEWFRQLVVKSHRAGKATGRQ